MVNFDSYYGCAEAKSQYLMDTLLPPATAVEVKTFVLKGLFIEIEGVAVLD
jgi:enamine deaminase RidA (YjgF/YER057c/UK114 family)